MTLRSGSIVFLRYGFLMISGGTRSTRRPLNRVENSFCMSGPSHREGACPGLNSTMRSTSIFEVISPRACGAHDFIRVEAAGGIAEQQPQHPALRFREKRVGQPGFLRSHIGNDSCRSRVLATAQEVTCPGLAAWETEITVRPILVSGRQ